MLDGPGSNPGRDEIFPVQTGPGAHTVSSKMDTGSFRGGGKLRPGRDAGHSPF